MSRRHFTGAHIGVESPHGLAVDTSISFATGPGGVTLTGGPGDDTLQGGDGNDTLYGGGGDDLLIGGAGNDRLDGGDGVDTASYADALSGVKLNLLNTTAHNTLDGKDLLINIENLIGSDFDDKITGDAGANALYGGGGPDVLHGGDGNDTLDGGSGDDKVFGNAGDDVVSGGAGDDRVWGGLGDDTIIGGLGTDRLTGETGADLFVFQTINDSTVAAPDLITDFTSVDRIDLSGIDADPATPGRQPFHLGATPGHVGDIVVTHDKAHGLTIIDLYTDADSTPDSRILLTGPNHTLTAGDFVL